MAADVMKRTHRFDSIIGRSRNITLVLSAVRMPRMWRFCSLRRKWTEHWPGQVTQPGRSIWRYSWMTGNFDTSTISAMAAVYCDCPMCGSTLINLTGFISSDTTLTRDSVWTALVEDLWLSNFGARKKPNWSPWHPVIFSLALIVIEVIGPWRTLRVRQSLGQRWVTAELMIALSFSGCISDFRWDDNYMPLNREEEMKSRTIGKIVSSSNAHAGCDLPPSCSMAPFRDMCGHKHFQECRDFWKGPFCTCVAGSQPELSDTGTLRSCRQEAAALSLGITSGAVTAILVSLLMLISELIPFNRAYVKC